MTTALKRSISALDGAADAGAASSKRPHLFPPPHDAAPNGNGAAEDDESEEPAYRGLDVYRKEAIYRHLLEARRDLARAEQRAYGLQQSWDATQRYCEEWRTLWDTLLQDLERLIPNDPDLSNERSILSSRASSSNSSIEQRSMAVRRALQQVASRGGAALDQNALHARLSELSSESASLRSQLTSVASERARLSDDLEGLTAALRKAERRADRLASPTVRKTERPKEEEENAREAAAEAERQRIAEREAKQAEEDRKPAQLLPNGVAGAAITAADLEAERNAAAQEVSDALAEAMLRLDEGDALRAQLQAAREEAEQLRREIACMPDERMLETPCYRELHTHFMAALEEMERTKRVLEGVEEENTELRTQLIEKSTIAQEEVSGQLEELRSALKAHEADVARLRGQRDDLSAELSERRQRENVKLTQVDEMKALLNAREARIATLRSEVRRAHMTLAARSGDEAALQRARGSQGEDDGEDDVALIEELQSRLKAAENEAADLKRQLDARSSSTTEAELIARAAQLQEQLDALKALLEGASSGEDVQSRLQDYTQKVATMRLELDAAAESTTALCDEVDRLSAAYADVERLANAKVLDVVHTEDKMLRLTTEKSKADNKYFSAMRAKDAVDAERKLALRTAERQGKALERAAEAEKVLIAQLAAGEREGALRRRAMDEQAAKLVEVERDAKLLRIREAEALRAKTHAEARLAALFPQQSEETRALAREREARARLEKDLEKAKRDLEASAAAASASAAGSAIKARKTSTSDADTQVDYLNSLLRCSACKERYRDRIITKCLHTFCSSCIDARIQTRQRKCPHCASSFATSDVQPLYLQ